MHVLYGSEEAVEPVCVCVCVCVHLLCGESVSECKWVYLYVRIYMLLLSGIVCAFEDGHVLICSITVACGCLQQPMGSSRGWGSKAGFTVSSNQPNASLCCLKTKELSNCSDSCIWCMACDTTQARVYIQN